MLPGNCQGVGSLTLIAQYATPIRIADAFPGAAIAGAMLAARIDHALVAQWTTPAGSTSVHNGGKAKFVISYEKR